MVKAIGGSNGEIYRLLMRQAVVIAVTGYIAGTVLAFLIKPLAKKGDIELLLSPSLLGIVFVSTVALCLLASTVSFRKVSRIDPALLFRS